MTSGGKCAIFATWSPKLLSHTPGFTCEFSNSDLQPVMWIQISLLIKDSKKFQKKGSICGGAV
jgi:hypothetical protein